MSLALDLWLSYPSRAIETHVLAWHGELVVAFCGGGPNKQYPMLVGHLSEQFRCRHARPASQWRRSCHRWSTY